LDEKSDRPSINELMQDRHAPGRPERHARDHFDVHLRYIYDEIGEINGQVGSTLEHQLRTDFDVESGANMRFCREVRRVPTCCTCALPVSRERVLEITQFLYEVLREQLAAQG
jgi:hypothetical protein